MKGNSNTTLAGILDIPQVRPWNMKSLQLEDLHEAAHRFMTHQDGVMTPEADQEAVEFYTLNHLASIIAKHRSPNETLSLDEIRVVRKWRDVLLTQSQRVFYYIALITTREIRHAYESHNMSSAMRAKFIKECGEKAVLMQEEIRSSNWKKAINVMKTKGITAYEWFSAVEYMFNEGMFAAGFGGQPWAKITNCLNCTLSGEYSMEMMVDTSYTLAHNNGPMHNKAMLYGGYTSDFLRILDVQRAGFMPEMVHEFRNDTYHIPEYLRHMVATIKGLYPGEIGDYVNWKEVKERGAVTDVSEYIKSMYKLYPESKVSKPVDGKIDTGEVYVVDHAFSLPILKRVA